ncbi:MAG: DNA-binding response regulator [Bacteroidetes bacterium]|nr:DNA-binding response regulator [Bacteroidota bacterium]
MKVAIVEDEELSQNILVRLLNKIDPTIEIAVILDSVEESVKWFSENVVDLIFMDIHLSDGNSFLIFDEVVINTPIIFTTSYDNYTLKAFDVNSVSYIMKPINEVKLKKAIAKLEDLGYIKQKNEKQFKNRFSVKVGNNIIVVDTRNIAYFYNEGRDCFIITNDGDRYIVDYTIAQLEQILDGEIFFQISRACIATIESIDRIQKITNTRMRVSLTPKFFDDVIVSQKRIDEFTRWLNS